MTDFPWVRIYHRGVNRGGGIPLTSQLVVTAAHCVAGVCDDHPEDEVTASLGHGTTPVPVPARLVERVAAKDLALLKLSQPLGSSVRLPWASRCRRGDGWFAPSRPTQSDPELDGSVSGTRNYECVGGGVVVLSRRALLGLQRSRGPAQLLPGEHLTCVVSAIANSGVFVDIDGIEGLVHISELSWKHIDHPSEVVEVGQEITVEVIKLVSFGVFVRVADGIEGLVHNAEMAEEPVEFPEEFVRVGDRLQVKIIDLDLERRRVSLSMKQAGTELSRTPLGEREREVLRLLARGSTQAEIAAILGIPRGATARLVAEVTRRLGLRGLRP